MHDRTTLGFAADAAETCALTMADPNATERIFAACDERALKRAREQAIYALSARVRRRFGDKYARIARAYLNGKTLERKSIPHRTFLYAVKKIKILWSADKQRVRPLLLRVASA